MLFNVDTEVVNFSADGQGSVRLSSASTATVAFKVRLTHAQCFACRPAKGLLAPGESAILTFSVVDESDGYRDGRFMIVANVDGDESISQKLKLGAQFPEATVTTQPRAPTTPPPPLPAAPAAPPAVVPQSPISGDAAAAAATAAPHFFIHLRVIELMATFANSACLYGVQWKRGATEGALTLRLGGGGRVQFDEAVAIPAETVYKADGTVARRLLQLAIVEQRDADDSLSEIDAAGTLRIIGTVKIDTTEFVAEERQADIPVKLVEGISGEALLSIRIAMSYSADASFGGGAAPTAATVTGGEASHTSQPPSSVAAVPQLASPASPAAASTAPRTSPQPRAIPVLPSPLSPRPAASGGGVGGGANPLEAFERDKPKSTNMMVCIRVRPLLARLEASEPAWTIENDGTSIIDAEDHRYDFDKVIDPSWNNLRVYDHIAPRFIENALIGINGTIFMYGQTASGKTHTMFGEPDEPGITPLVLRDLFARIAAAEASSGQSFSVTASYFEIYNEELNDLLNPTNKNVPVRSGKDGAFVAEVTREKVTSAANALEVLMRGSENKKMGQSHLNDRSSRSHSIFQLRVRCVAGGGDGGSGAKKRTTLAELNLVDLAGSETMSEKGDTAQKKETSHINLSLTFLKKVIGELAHKEKFVSYRNSVLTKILKQSLGGNSATCVVCCVTIAKEHFRDTRNTLVFGSTARTVVTNVRVNAESDDNLREEVKLLREQVKAYQDAVAAYQGIEEDLRRSEEENASLVQQIGSLQSQLAAARSGIATTPETATTGGGDRTQPAADGPPKTDRADDDDGEALELVDDGEDDGAGGAANTRQQGSTNDDDDEEALELVEDDEDEDDATRGSGGAPINTSTGSAKPPPTALHTQLAPKTRPVVIGGDGESEATAAAATGIAVTSAGTIHMTEVERLRKQLMQQRVEHRAQLLRKNEELRAALLTQQQKATTEVPEVLKKEEKICTLLDQIHSFLHYGTVVSVVDAKGASVAKSWLHLTTSAGGDVSLNICALSDDNKPNKKDVKDTMPVKDCKRVELGQFSEPFEKLTAVEAHKALRDRYRMSFTIVGRKKRTFDVICEDESDFEAWVIELNKLLGNVAEWKKPLDITAMESFALLDTEEREFCSSLHIYPSEYIHAKTQMTKMNEKFVTLFDVRSLTKLDLYHSQRFFYFMRCRGWISQASMFYLTEKFSEITSNLDL